MLSALCAMACGEAEPVAVERASPAGDAGPADGSEAVGGTAVEAVCGDVRPSEGNAHVPPGTTVTYRHDPPLSGPHYGAWVASGIYDEPVDPRGWVHNLEHGWMVVLHAEDAAPELVEVLHDFWRRPPGDPQCPENPRPRIIVSPARGLPADVGVAAWTRGFSAPTVTRAQLEAFFDACREAAPELSVCADGGPAPFLEPEP
jgi:hypothetical protein